MEVVPFAWLLMRSARRAAEWGEARGAATRRELARARRARVRHAPDAPGRRHRIAVDRRCPVASSRAAAAHPRLGGRSRCAGRWSCRSSSSLRTGTLRQYDRTGQVAAAQSVLRPARFTEAVSHNLDVLFNTLFDGRMWSAIFVPQGSRWVTWLALPGARDHGGAAPQPAGAGCASASSRSACCCTTTYDSFLWNRLRYLWPFAAAWFVALGALADGVGAHRGAALARPRLGARAGGRRVRWAGWPATLVDARGSRQELRRDPPPAGRAGPLGARRTARPTRASASTTPALSRTSPTGACSTSAG